MVGWGRWARYIFWWGGVGGGSDITTRKLEKNVNSRSCKIPPVVVLSN